MFKRSRKTAEKPRELTWQERAVLAEAELAVLRAALEQADQRLKGIELLMADRAALVSIRRDGRMNKFTFVRNGELTVIETFGSWDDDPDRWRKILLDKRTPPDGDQTA